MSEHERGIKDMEELFTRARTVQNNGRVPFMMEGHTQAILMELTGRTAEDLAMDEHLTHTPERFARMLWFMTHPEPFEFTTFPNTKQVDEMVVVKDIPFYSLCAHHLAPFFGVAHVGYIPGSRIAGLSKFPRAVRFCARGLWVQEELGVAIADMVDTALADCVGLALVLEAEHLCMSMRGVQVPGTRTTTSVMRGVFADHDRQARAEFLSLIRSNK